MQLDVPAALFKAFMKDPGVWAPSTFWDDTRIGVNGAFSDDDPDFEALAATDVVRVECGYLVNQPEGVPADLIDCLQWWLAARTEMTMVISFPPSLHERVKACLGDLGVTVKAG